MPDAAAPPAPETAEAAATQTGDDADRAPRSERGLAALSVAASRVCLWTSGAGLVAISAIILWQVFARYVLNASPSWSEQLTLYLLVWTVLLGAAAGVREGFHIRITALQDGASPAARKALEIAAHLITASVGLFLAWHGTALVAALWPYEIPTLGLPRGSAFAPLPLGGALMAAFALEHAHAALHDRKVRPLWR